MPRKPVKPEQDVVKVTVVLRREVVERLDALASDERRSRSNLAALLLERGLTDRQAG